MAKRKFLEVKDQSDFLTLLGLSCKLLDYHLSFYLNRQWDFQFVKQDDFVYGTPGSDDKHLFSFYASTDEDHVNIYYLLSNRSQDHLLIPSLKQTDFLMFIDGVLKESRKEELLKTIRSVPRVLLATEINPAVIKHIDHLINELELHRMSIAQKPINPNP